MHSPRSKTSHKKKRKAQPHVSSDSVVSHEKKEEWQATRRESGVATRKEKKRKEKKRKEKKGGSRHYPPKSVGQRDMRPSTRT